MFKNKTEIKYILKLMILATLLALWGATFYLYSTDGFSLTVSSLVAIAGGSTLLTIVLS